MKTKLIPIITLIIAVSFSYKGVTQEKTKDIIWHVKAFKPDAKFLRIKAFDARGRKYDVKAIQNSDQTSLLDVKAIVKGKTLPVKMLVIKGDKYYPVKAIAEDGTILNIKAITEDGKILPVKGVSKSGNIVHIRAIYNDTVFYNVLAISPKGKANVVKGLKMSTEEVETTIHGIEVFAHIKAIQQSDY
ncbi:hypothetical protein [Seonamhaeicola sp.]|uniref:DUF7486 family protein n=1 Tax=Seonamhaeicola sp. TaxID=1912245 RepID=UPI0026273845|nr:hypothetical protein [Seonamhaeicola sp.]